MIDAGIARIDTPERIDITREMAETMTSEDLNALRSSVWVWLPDVQVMSNHDDFGPVLMSVRVKPRVPCLTTLA